MQSYNKEFLNHVFEEVCKYGKLDIVKWLYSFGVYNDINLIITLRASMAFYNGCLYGHKNVVMWLYELGGNSGSNNEDEKVSSRQSVEINNILDYDSALLFSSKNGHIDVVKWLYSISSEIDENTYCDAFEYSCTYSQLSNESSWLSQESHHLDSQGLSQESHHLETAKFLYNTISSFNKNYTIKTDNDIFIKCCYNGHIDIAKWLYSMYPNAKCFVTNENVKFLFTYSSVEHASVYNDKDSYQMVSKTIDTKQLLNFYVIM